jgi:hypothetical protein
MKIYHNEYVWTYLYINDIVPGCGTYFPTRFIADQLFIVAAQHMLGML